MLNTPARKPRLTRWRLIIVGVVCLNVLILAFAYKHSSREAAASEDEALPQYDGSINLPPPLAQIFKADHKLLVLTVFNADNPDPRLHYLDVLYRRHKERGLDVVAIHAGTPQRSEQIKQELGLSFPVINDRDQQMQRQLHLFASHPHDAVLVVDDSHRVKFAQYQIPKEDEMRMIVEKYLLGNVDYSFYKPQPYEFFRQGRRMPALDLQLVGSHSVIRFESRDLAGKELLLFLADCAPCQMKNYFTHLANFEKAAGSTGSQAIALFDSNFQESDLIENARELGIHMPIYILRGNVEQLHEEYATRIRLEASGPLRITCDGGGAVKRIGSLLEEEAWREADSAQSAP